MKKISKLLVLTVLLLGWALPSWSQVSTQGKEFWVALLPSKSPNGEDPAGKTSGDNKYTFEPYIAISAKKKCTVTVSNPSTTNGWTNTYSITSDNAWLEIKDIPKEKWYTEGGMPGTGTYDLGLKVEADEEISVFCALRWTYSFDATNVLPITALQSEYIVQTYEPSDKSYKKNAFSIVAAEDCTVDITPTDGSNPTSISLKAGQVYHRISKEMESLSGSHIVARDEKKIAVFAGAPLANVPTNKSDRDLLYEQLFPVDYWGQNFVVVRTKEKDVNRVIITAQEDNTEVTIYGNYDSSTDKKTAPHKTKKDYSFILNSGESYEFEMSAGYAEDERGGVPQDRWSGDRATNLDGLTDAVTFVDSAIYIQTSCPCAVLSYDVGNSYLRDEKDIENGSFLTEAYYTLKSNGKEYDKIWGAPAMTWIAPIEQMIDDIVFGVMGTDKTDRHFVNIVIPTQDIANTYIGSTLVDNIAKFKPVEANPNYSYARLTLEKTTSSGMYYHLYNKLGFIATVYGNGDDESYAYSAGSSAVALGVITVGDQVFVDGGFSDEAYCVNDELTFDASAGTTIIDKVEWDFGDGTSTTITEANTTHKYTTPGWFDVTAKLYAHKDCPATTYPPFDVSFTFRVIRPDTIRHITDTCVGPDYQGRESYSIEKKYDCDSVVITQFYVLHKSYKDSIHTAQDIAYVHGETYTEDAEVEWIEKNSVGCDSVTTCQIRIRRCLNLEITNDAEAQQICAGARYDLPLSIAQGSSAGNVYLIVNGKRTNLGYLDRFAELEDEGNRRVGTIELPIDKWNPGRYQASIEIEDLNCGDKNPAQSPVLDFLVKYPAETVLTFKFNNILAVLNKANNGGYDFRGFQWYRNGEAIPDEITAVYYTDAPFTPGDVYYVMLTDKNNVTLPSCEFIVPEDLPNYNEPQQAPAKKVLVGRQMCIMKDGMVFDVYGQRIQ